MTTGAQIDVAAWLQGLGLTVYAPAFAANDIDGAVLADLTSADLAEIGVASVGHRRKILAAIAARLPPAPPAKAERRILTVMFCDMVDSVGLSAGNDAEDFREFIAQFRQDVETTIRPFGGHVSQFLGDGVMASFGYPTASGHDAERAVAAGLAVIDKVARMQAFGGAQVQVRVGIATGLAVVGRFDDGQGPTDDSAIGDTPNLASRLQGVAAPGCVVVTDQTRTLIGEIFDCTDQGLVPLKGIALPVAVWQVNGRSSTASRYDALRRTRHGQAFVGRSTELAALKSHFTRMQQGVGPITVVCGDTGIGKSRLVQQAIADGARGMVPLVLQPSPYGMGFPFYAVRYFVAQACGVTANGSPDQAAVQISQWLQGHNHDTATARALILQFLELAQTDDAALAQLGPQLIRSRTIGLLTDLLIAEIRQTGALIIEDVQWIDPSTAELLGALVPRALDACAIVVATAPTGLLPDWLTACDAELLPLDRLSALDTTALITGLAGSQPLPPDVRDTIVARSDGVPIFAEELLRGYLEARLDGSDALAQVPLSLSESLLARLDRLVNGRRIASVAAAIGREFPLAVLTAVSDLPASVLTAGIGELLAAGVFAPAQSRFGEAIRFRHNLVCDAAYGLLLRKQKVDLHARIADTLCQHFPAIATAAPHVLAIQRSAASQPELAQADWARAGQLAVSRSAYAEAARFFVSAIDANALTPDDPLRAPRELELRLNLMAALVCAKGFQAHDVAQQTERIVALGRSLNTSAQLVAALHLRWVQLLTSNQAQAARDLAFQLRDSAVAAGGADRLLILRMCATSLLFCGQLPQAQSHYLEFMALYDPDLHAGQMRMGHSDHAAIVLMGLAETCTLTGDLAAAALWQGRALAHVQGTGRHHDRCHVLTFAGCMHPYLRRNYAEVADHARQLAALLAAEPSPNWSGYLDLFKGLLAAQGGDAADGLATARRGVEALLASKAFGNWWALFYAEACLNAADPAEAARVLNIAQTIQDQGDTRFSAEYHRLCARRLIGDHGGAAACLAKAAAIAQNQYALLLLDRIRADQARL